MMWAPLATAYSIASIRSASLAVPSLLNGFRPISDTFQATPAIPVELLPRAPMMPDTKDPCPCASLMFAFPSKKLNPWRSST